MGHREQNISALAGYFALGCKKEKLIGLELEHFVVQRETRRSLRYEGGVEQILRRLQPVYGEAVLSQGRIIGIAREGAAITLEPAAQLEISIGPARGLDEIRRVYDEFAGLLQPILDDMGCELVCAGYHPKSAVDELTMIPKQRYEFMYEYFKTAGTRGKYMMKGSAATQVSIDYESEADFYKKFRVANALGPLFSLLCDNAPVFEGRPYKGRMARTFIWNDVDPARSMVVKGALDGDFGFRGYAEYIYDMPSIFTLRGGEALYTGLAPVSELFARRAMTRADIEHFTSLAFPDVCLKNHLEIRMADSMPIHGALAFTALVKGLFYDAESLEALFQMTLGLRNRDVAQAKAALMKHGAEAEIYGVRARGWLDKILRMARGGLDEDEQELLLYMESRER